MKCPVCVETDLLMSERQGIEIDYCPKCRGIWLDRGELDKLLERAAREDVPAGPPTPSPYAQQRSQPQYRPDLDDSKYGYQYKRKKSWWQEVFD